MSRLGDTLMGMDSTSGRPLPLGGLPGVLGAVVRRRRGLVASAFLLSAILTIMVLAVMVHLRRSAQPPTPLPAVPSETRAESASAANVLPQPTGSEDLKSTAGALVHEGLRAAQRGAFDEAARSFERALETNPRDAETWNNLGVALTRQGDLAGGVAAFRKAIGLEALRAEAHRNLGVALERQGNHRDAARHYRTFLSLVGEDHPDRAAIRQRLVTAATGAK
jgi:tetratricopeptide (TPR) repeat protein